MSELTRVAAVDRFGDELRVRAVPMPVPGPGEVLVRVTAAAVNPADLGMVSGRYRWPEPVRFPLVPGYDLAGVVEARGPAVTGFALGTAVIGNTAHSRTQLGSYAGHVALPVGQLAAAPPGLDPVRAATLPLAGLTAWQALAALDLTPGETLLVNGPLGAVGGFAAQLAAGRGVTVAGPVRPAHRDLARSLGVTVPLNRTDPLGRDDPTDRDPLPIEGVDAALDVVGGAAAVAALAAVRDGGRYRTVVPEFWVPGGPFTPRRGITPGLVLLSVIADQLAALADLAGAGRLTTRVAEVFPLADAAAAHRRVAAGGLLGKVVLIP